MKKLETTLMQMASQLQPVNAVNHKTLMDNTRASIKKRYRDAFYKLRSRVVNISSKEALAQAFVKYEKIPYSKYEERKPPRLIQFRDFTYTYALKRQLLGHALQIKSNEILWAYQQRADTIFTKIMDNYGIANALFDSWSVFADPIALCLDHSKFDGHYDLALLQLEHKYWTTINNSRALKWLLSHQLTNKVRSKCGLQWKTTGTRLSGEWTTSEGNTVMNYAMIVTYLKSSGIQNARVHVNGDDSVIILSRCERSKLLPLKFFRHFNMETEVEVIAEDFRKISYCQASPLRVLRNGEKSWYMVKEPRRTLSRLQYCDARYEPVIHRFLKGIGLCESAVNSGIPVTQALSNYLASLKCRPIGAVDKGPALSSGNDIQFKPVEDVTRVDYEYAFGITTEHQLAIEEYISGLIRSPTDLQATLNFYRTFHKN